MGFGSLNIEELQKEYVVGNNNNQQQRNTLDDYVVMPDPPAGKTASITVRILPPAMGAKLFQYNRYHKINGRRINCPRPMKPDGYFDKSVPNPIADYIDSLWVKIRNLRKIDEKSPEADGLYEEYSKIKAVVRYYYNVIVREMIVDGEKQINVGPKILSVGKILHDKIRVALFGDDTEERLGDVTNLKSGYDFVIRVTKDGEFPKYDRSAFARDPSPAGTPDEIERWAQNLHDLSKLRTIPKFEDLEREMAIYLGYIQDEQEGFNEDVYAEKYGSKVTSVVQDSHVVEEVPVSSVTQEDDLDVDVDIDLEEMDIDVSDFAAELEEFKSIS